MKVSIITVCYNSQSTIEDTIRSVLEQDYPDIEYMVVDGKSTDDTLKIVNRYSEKISRIISEKDEGMYDAINKGIKLATGEIVAVLNSDDFYIHEKVISQIVSKFQEDGSEAVYADLQYVDRLDKSKVIRYWKSGIYKTGMFVKGWMPPHPAFFVRKTCYDKFGLFNTTLKSAADYELMLRFIHKHHISIDYIPEVLVKMRMGGKSNVSLMNRIKANREDLLAWRINGLKPGLFTFIRKPLSKLKQFF